MWRSAQKLNFDPDFEEESKTLLLIKICNLTCKLTTDATSVYRPSKTSIHKKNLHIHPHTYMGNQMNV
jgi:hypothetical protein